MMISSLADERHDASALTISDHYAASAADFADVGDIINATNFMNTVSVGFATLAWRYAYLPRRGEAPANDGRIGRDERPMTAT